MTTRDQVVAEARTWLSTPYHHMGRIKGVGVDCGQILIEVFSTVGMMPRIETGYYPHDWHFHRDEERYLGWIKQFAHQVETPQPGDIALFKFGRCISHGAIVLDWPMMIHAYHDRGVVYESANSLEMKGRLDSFWSMFK